MMKMTIKGKMEFAVLYRKENGGLETLGGNIPFEEMVNVPGLKEGDDVTTSWILEDMKAEMIDSGSWESGSYYSGDTGRRRGKCICSF